MKDLSSLFYNSFLANVSLSENEESIINDAKQKIQTCLRTGIAMILKEQEGILITPRFLSQGSGKYKTRNRPCHVPPQQADHDLGCYLPLTMLQDTGTPRIAARIFFNIVDSLLDQLVKKEKWNDYKTNKKTCGRIIVNNWLHIDVPLYSIPDTEFHLITESAKILKSMNFADRQDSKPDRWDNYPVEKVLLAHRSLGWKESDPRKLNEYFKNAFKEKGEQLRRLCRYFKAWRDYKWYTGGPTSIHLMLLIDSIYDSYISSRDDIALVEILSKMGKLNNFSLRNPTDKKEPPFELDKDDSEKFKAAVSDFLTDITKAIVSDCSSLEACRFIQNHLGERFPCVSFLSNIQEYWENNKGFSNVSFRDNEEFIENKFPIDIRYELTIDCKVKQDGFRDFFLLQYISNGHSLHHHKNLDFFVSQTNVPEPYVIYWKVRNVGKVAEKRDCIRGEITQSKSNKKSEHTDFWGPHFVECYIIRYGVCVARDRIDVPIDKS